MSKDAKYKKVVIPTLRHGSRKTIEIVASFTSEGKYFVLALCDDGTLWKLHGLYEGDPKWEPFPIPPAV